MSDKIPLTAQELSEGWKNPAEFQRVLPSELMTKHVQARDRYAVYDEIQAKWIGEGSITCFFKHQQSVSGHNGLLKLDAEGFIVWPNDFRGIRFRP